MLSLLLGLVLTAFLAVLLLEITALSWVACVVIGMVTSAFVVAAMEGV